MWCEVFHQIESCPIKSHLNNFQWMLLLQFTYKLHIISCAEKSICWERKRNNFPSHNLWGWVSEEDSSKYFRRKLKSLIFSFRSPSQASPLLLLLCTAFASGYTPRPLMLFLLVETKANKTSWGWQRATGDEYLLCSNLKLSLNFHLQICHTENREREICNTILRTELNSSFRLCLYSISFNLTLI